MKVHRSREGLYALPRHEAVHIPTDAVSTAGLLKTALSEFFTALQLIHLSENKQASHPGPIGRRRAFLMPYLEENDTCR